MLVVPYLAFSRKRLELLGFFEGAFHVCGVGVGVLLASCLVFLFGCRNYRNWNSMDSQAFTSGPLVIFLAACAILFAYLGYRLKAPLAFAIVTAVFMGSVVACFKITAG